MAKIPGILLLIFALSLVVYFANAGFGSKFGSFMMGPVFKSTSTAASSAPSQSFSDFFSLFRWPASTPTTNRGTYYSPPPTPTGATNPAPSYSPSDIPPGYTAAQLSPWFHQVRLGGVSQQQISLSAYGSSGQSGTIDLTGWEVKTNRGGIFIPQATIIYEPIGAAVLSDIILPLNQSQNVYLYSSSAPVNLRLNKCLGYLNTTRQFNPPFPTNCPYVNRSSISNFSGACQNYILSLNSCQSPDFGSANFPKNDYQCETFLKDRFNYESCVTEHHGDADFFANEWRVWVGNSPLDRFHDNVVLLDRSGLVVDWYSY